MKRTSTGSAIFVLLLMAFMLASCQRPSDTQEPSTFPITVSTMTPSEEPLESISSDALVDRKKVEIGAYTMYGQEAAVLKEDQESLLLWYADLLLNEMDPPASDRVSEEVEASWNDLKEEDSVVVPLRVLWEDEELFVVDAYFRSEEAGITREHLIEFVKKEQEWCVNRDILGHGDLLFDAPTEETMALKRELFHRQRALNPLSEEEIEAAKNAAIQRELLFKARNMNEAERASYEESLEVIYDPEWEEDHLELALTKLAYMRTDLLLYLARHDGSETGDAMLAWKNEDGTWDAFYSYTEDLEPPASLK